MPLALARKTHRAAACLTAAIACCAACLCAGCTGAATHAAGATSGSVSAPVSWRHAAGVELRLRPGRGGRRGGRPWRS